MSEKEAVFKANDAFYQAFESLDIAKMEAVWVKAPYIVCIHPGWRKLSGWGPIMQSWGQIFDSVFQMKFELSHIDLILRSDVAIVVNQENLTQRGYDGTMRTQVLATNVYERSDGQWRLVLHHGSPVAAQMEEEPPIQ